MRVDADERKVKRLSVSFSLEEYESVRAHARRQGISISQFIRDAALRAVLSADLDSDPLAEFVGVLHGGSPDGAENHDDYIYGPRCQDDS